MKKFTLAGAVLFSALSAGNALAAPAAGNFGFNIDLTSPATPLGTPSVFMLEGRYSFTKDWAVLAGVGLQIRDSGAVTDSRHSDIGFMGGIRKYLKTEDLSPFVGGKLLYMSTRQGTSDVIDVALLAEGGAEYFLGKQFSLEGSVGFGYASRDSKPVGGAASTKATGFGTTTFSLSANYYF